MLMTRTRRTARGVLAGGFVAASVAATLCGQAMAVPVDAPGGQAPFPELPAPPPVPDQLVIITEMRPKGRASYVALLTREAERRGLPPAVADAVAGVESSYDPMAVGKVGELGLMQVRPGTAAMLGHRGPATALFDPEINVRYGVIYLATAWELAKGDLCRTLMKYRAGHGEERMTPLSVDYCRRARVRLAAIGSPLATSPLPLPSAYPATSTTRQASTGSVSGSIPAAARAKVHSPPIQDPIQVRRLADMKRLWAEHAARVRKIESNIEQVMADGRR